MTIEEKYILAKWAINHALEKGAQQAGINISNNKSSGIDIRDEKIDRLEQAIESNLTIRLFVDKKYSVHSTNRLKKEELARFIEQAIEGTRYLSEDEFRTLPDPELYYKGGDADLNITDKTFENITPEKKIELAFAAEKEALGKDKRIISITTSYYDWLNEWILVDSNGFSADSSNSYFGLNALVSVKSDLARPSADWGENAIFFDRLIKSGIGETALNRAIKKIGEGKIASGKMDMIVENRQVARLFSPLISALSGSAIQQKNSFLIDKLGEKVISDKITLIDDPFILGGHGSRVFDAEGLATQKRLVFEKGIIRQYYIDTYYGKKLNMKPNSGSTTNLVFETGNKDLQSLIATVDKGILVTGFNGGNCNSTTGDFSFGIDGFLIEKCQIVKPVSEMNITGNMLELWSNIRELGNDVNTNSSWLMPSILFEGVDFSGI